MTEASTELRAPRGTRDLLPPQSWRWRRVVNLADEIFTAAGYAPIDTPVFEATELFERGVGETSEVVTKQMYTFTDLGGRSLTLRPEGTAPVMRAVLEHGLERGRLPVKVSYAGPMFRQERPQKGRYRQFFQVGIEAIGSEAPLVDAEVIELGVRFYRAAGVDATLLLNSIGHVDPSCRSRYLEILAGFLTDRRADLAAPDRDRVESNPLRTFDSKEPATVAVMAGAPSIADHLCPACRDHFDEVQGLLSDLDVAFTLEPRLVRGLDYYTRTTFEWVAGGLGSQNAVGGGGRYDGLSETLGGPRLPGIGIAPGIDRILLALEQGKPYEPPTIRAYVVALGDGAGRPALRLATDLRRAGVATDLDLAGRSMKGQMKDAARSGARFAIILGDQEVARGEATVKDLESGAQRTVAAAEVEALVRP
ncbi:MAG: histidine--tRNA ligase [Actinomycetota bacterium]